MGWMHVWRPPNNKNPWRGRQRRHYKWEDVIGYGRCVAGPGSKKKNKWTCSTYRAARQWVQKHRPDLKVRIEKRGEVSWLYFEPREAE